MDWWQRVKRRIQWCVPVHEQLALFARSLARSLASSIIIRPLCPPAISAALSPSTMSTWHSPSRSRTLLTHPAALSFNHKAHRRRTRSRGGSLALPRRRGCTLTVSPFLLSRCAMIKSAPVVWGHRISSARVFRKVSISSCGFRSRMKCGRVDSSLSIKYKFFYFQRQEYITVNCRIISKNYMSLGEKGILDEIR